jgi:hypothetical protein
MRAWTMSLLRFRRMASRALVFSIVVCTQVSAGNVLFCRADTTSSQLDIFFYRPAQPSSPCLAYDSRNERCVRNYSTQQWSCWRYPEGTNLELPVWRLNPAVCTFWDIETIQKTCRLWTEEARLYGEISAEAEAMNWRSKTLASRVRPLIGGNNSSVPPEYRCLLPRDVR